MVFLSSQNSAHLKCIGVTGGRVMGKKNSFYTCLGKRWFDLLLTVPSLILLSPVFAVLALSIRFKMGKPVLFRHIRPGLHGKPFTIYKFRTMIDSRDENGKLLPDAERLTRLGRFLRNTSLDEIPELWNILKGDMSLVGPRPLLLQYLQRYSTEQARRHEVYPGLTGSAQVLGRNEVLFSQRLEWDVWYVDNISFYEDVKILLATVMLVLSQKGVIADQDVHDIDDLGLYDDNIGVNDENK